MYQPVQLHNFAEDFHDRVVLVVASFLRSVLPPPVPNILFLILLTLYTFLRTGVRYEDLIIEEPSVVEAVKLADLDVQHGRIRRLKRASDLCFKAKTLHDYAPNMILEPFKEEIYEDILKIRQRDQEYDALNYHKK